MKTGRKKNKESSGKTEVYVLPPPPAKRRKINLSSLADVRREAAAVYRDARQGTIDTQDASRLAFVLMTISKMIELETIDARLAELEWRAENGNRNL